MNKALVIGINNYQSITPLKGCINDAKLFSETLLNNGFKVKGIKFLFDQYATRKNILKSIKWLQKESGKKYFYFAGHGSQTVDLDRDEVDGLDEIFMTYDSFIKDDEINKLSSIRKDIIFIFDSCHSGTINRDPNTNTRTIYQSEGFDFYREYLQTKFKTKEEHKYISACKDNETAKEVIICGHNSHGVFTYNLCYLINKYPKYRFKRIFKLLKEELEEYDQTPQTNIKENIHIL